jgi:5-methylcytosine-specific restriction endonuclease McrA
MPTSPLPGCAVPGCPGRATHRGRCRTHDAARTRERRQRTHHAQLLGSPRWQQARAVFLARPENRWCAYCAQAGRQTASECIDHRDAAKADPAVFWDRSRWVPACLRCNTQKGIRQEGGFGRAPSTRSPRGDSRSETRNGSANRPLTAHTRVERMRRI